MILTMHVMIFYNTEVHNHLCFDELPLLGGLKHCYGDHPVQSKSPIHQNRQKRRI